MSATPAAVGTSRAPWATAAGPVTGIGTSGFSTSAVARAATAAAAPHLHKRPNDFATGLPPVQDLSLSCLRGKATQWKRYVVTLRFFTFR
ncbi:hypothetical protein GCM10023405_30350 [Streptomonospora salina]